MTNPTGPSAFVGGQGGSYRPPAIQPSRTDEPRAAYVAARPARVTVQADGTVLVSAEAARPLPNGDGTIDLRPPLRSGEPWHLDCRPGGYYRRQPVGATGGIRFRAALRVNAMLGACPGPLAFALEDAGNGLFALLPETVYK